MSNHEFRFLSVIVPAYKQEKTIVKDLKNVKSVLDRLTIPYEIIVVVDGKVDKTFNYANKFKAPNITIIAYEKTQGKGHAVRFGMMQAKGDVIGFIDAGMDIDPTGISMLLNHMLWYDADIIIGSKLHPVSQVDYPFARKILSWGYRTLTRILFGFKVRDTQAGLKFFKRRVVRKVFPRLIIKRFAFDIEILAVAYALGFRRIYEAPVKLNFSGASSITSTSLWKIILNMLWDTMAVFYRLKILHYYDRQEKKY